jgi:uncharacterized protein YueI
MDQDQKLDQSLKTEAIPSDTSGHSPLPIVLHSQAATIVRGAELERFLDQQQAA